MRKLALPFILGLTSCQGLIGSPAVPPDSPGTPGTPGIPDPNNPPPVMPPPVMPPPVDACAGVGVQPGPAPMRRLTNAEYRNTVADLIGRADLAAEVSAGFTQETESLGFRNNANFLEIPQVLAQQYLDAAEHLAETSARGLVRCDPQAIGEDVCAEQFVRSFGERAYRRPLEQSEVDRYMTLYQGAKADYDFDTGVEWIVFAMLQAPSFLHRIELSTPPSGSAYAPPSSYEMASRLSYLLWRSMPDDALFAEAAADRLATPAQVEAQARRMLADPKAHRAFDFYAEWLDIDSVGSMQRDTAVFPNLPSDLSALLEGEARSLVDHVLWELDGDFNTLMTAQYSFMNQRLAQHYGISGPSGEAFEKVALDASHAGILTTGAVLTVHDKPTRTSIVKRGLKVRTDLLCQTIGSPPNNVNLDLPPITGDMTQKERLEMHRTNATCAGCHNLMDPIGVVFEQFDAVGRFRTMDEGGHVIDPTSTLDFTRDANGPVADPASLAQRLAGSEQVKSCFTTQLFRYSYGRAETSADACTQQRLQVAFKDSGYKLRELLVSLTQTDAFLYRPAAGP